MRLAIISLFLLIISSVACLYHAVFLYKNPTDKVIIINNEEPTAHIVQKLSYDHTICNYYGALLLFKIQQLRGKYIHPGEYAISAGLNTWQIWYKLHKAERIVHSITIPEGFTVKQVVLLLQQAYGLRGTVINLPPEGTLLPETYNYYYGDKRDVLLFRMQKAMTDLLTTLPTFAPQKDLLTIASLVEKETRVAAERELVAAVYWNRLKRGMLLQADPTIVYGLSDGLGTLHRKVHATDLRLDNPYNTYIYKGLPPTPIANPGKAAVIAAAHPAEVDYLFFVADGQGGHKFSRTYSEHLIYVKQLISKK